MVGFRSLSSSLRASVLCLALGACTDPTDGGPDDTEGGTEPVCANTALGSQAATWTLPALGAAWAPHLADLYTNGVNYSVLDLTGDGRPELVVASGAGQPHIGTTAWLVYANTAAGFASAPMEWALPSLGSVWAEAVTDPYSNAVNYAVIDMTGDRRPDLVVASGTGPTNLGTTAWHVYENTGTGFAASPMTWTLPSLGSMWAIAPVDLYTNEVNYAVMNIHGDARPELVVASGAGHAGVGTTSWLVYDNTGTGFATTAVTWTLPSLGAGWAALPYDRFTDDVNWALVDIEGDTLPELVVTSGAGGPQVGTTVWHVYANTGAGFAASPASWPLPALGSAWAEHAYDRYSDGINYGLLDLRGDRLPDLVVASGLSDVTLGSTAWVVYENTGSSFATDAVRWTLPALGAGWATEVFDRHTDGINWGLTDMTGDGRSELVIASGTAPTVGTTSWLVHESICVD